MTKKEEKASFLSSSFSVTLKEKEIARGTVKTRESKRNKEREREKEGVRERER